MRKLEKLLITPVSWVYVGILSGLILGALFGGRGGLYFFGIGILAGCGVGLLRTIYVGFTYNENLTTRSISKKRVIARRIFFGLLYMPLLYFVGGTYLNPVYWIDPYTYEWGEATEIYFSRDGQVIVPRTVIEVKNDQRHYYGLRMSIDIHKCGSGSSRQFSNRRWYFILPIEEDAVIEFSNRGAFEAELKRRIPTGADELNYGLFDEKWNYYSAIYEKGKRSDCVVDKGA